MKLTPIYRSPDAAPGGAPLAPAAARTKALPTDHVTRAALGVRVAVAYEAGYLAKPAVGLIWLTAADFSTLTAAYAAEVQASSGARAEVSPLSNKLADLDAEINRRLGNVRKYLEQQYEDESATVVRSYLPQLGFKAQHGSYVFPRAQQERRAALLQLLQGLKQHGLEGRKYGLAYWTDLSQRYAALLTDANTAAGEVSELAAGKNELADQVIEALTAIRYLLRAQYPRNWKAKLRAYGYQAEGY